MNTNYEDLYFYYLQLKKYCKNNHCGIVDNIFKNINIKNDYIELFKKIGIILIKNNYYLFFDLNEKTINEIDLFFYYNNQNKLNKIFHENSDIIFFIHVIIYNINIYLSPEKLISIIHKKYSKNMETFDLIKNFIDEIKIAHEIVQEAGIIKKYFCFDNTYYNDIDKVIIIKDMWYYKNEFDNDYIKKIVFRNIIKNL